MGESGVIEPGIQTHQAILALCGLAGNELSETTDFGPIRPCHRKNVRSASYDLRLGSAYHSAPLPDGEASPISGLAVENLVENRNEHIIISPNQAVVVSTLEKLYMPDDLVGHLTLKQDVLLQGLIMASQSQIDAGYEGWIYSLLYNLSDGEIALRLNQSVMRLELVRLPEPTEASYSGDYQNASLARSLRRPIRSSLDDLRRKVEQRGCEIDAERETVDLARKEIEQERQKIGKTRLMIYFATALAAVIPLFLAFAGGYIGDLHDARDRISSLEGKITPTAESLIVQNRKTLRLQAQVSRLQCRIRQEEERSTGVAIGDPC